VLAYHSHVTDESTSDCLNGPLEWVTGSLSWRIVIIGGLVAGVLLQIAYIMPCFGAPAATPGSGQLGQQSTLDKVFLIVLMMIMVGYSIALMWHLSARANQVDGTLKPESRKWLSKSATRFLAQFSVFAIIVLMIIISIFLSTLTGLSIPDNFILAFIVGLINLCVLCFGLLIQPKSPQYGIERQFTQWAAINGGSTILTKNARET